MSILAGVVSQGLTVGEALGVLDSRQNDAWSRVDLDWEQTYDMQLRFGSKHPDDIADFEYKPTLGSKYK